MNVHNHKSMLFKIRVKDRDEHREVKFGNKIAS